MNLELIQYVADLTNAICLISIIALIPSYLLSQMEDVQLVERIIVGGLCGFALAFLFFAGAVTPGGWVLVGLILSIPAIGVVPLLGFAIAAHLS